MLGIQIQTKESCRLWNPRIRKVISASDVKFLEERIKEENLAKDYLRSIELLKKKSYGTKNDYIRTW